MDSKDELKIHLTTSESDNDFKSVNACNEVTQIEKVKSKDVPKDKHIKLNQDTLFQFDCIVNEDYLSLKLSEIDDLAPFIFLKNITLNEIRRYHKVFKSCENLNEVKEHIDRLFKNGKITLSQEKDKEDEIIFKFKTFYISYEDEFEIIAERRMTNNKDAMLLKLYEIQKSYVKLINEIQNYSKSGGANLKEVDKKIREFKEKEK